MGNPQQNRQLQGAYVQQQRLKEQERRFREEQHRRAARNRAPAIEFCEERVRYSGWWSLGPDERKIQEVVRRYEAAGWQCVGRREDKRLLTAYYNTILTFQR